MDRHNQLRWGSPQMDLMHGRPTQHPYSQVDKGSSESLEQTVEGPMAEEEKLRSRKVEVTRIGSACAEQSGSSAY